MQHPEYLTRERDHRNLGPLETEALLLDAMVEIGHRFGAGEPALDAQALCHKLDARPEHLSPLLDALIEAEALAEDVEGRLRLARRGWLPAGVRSASARWRTCWPGRRRRLGHGNGQLQGLHRVVPAHVDGHGRIRHLHIAANRFEDVALQLGQKARRAALVHAVGDDHQLEPLAGRVGGGLVAPLAKEFGQPGHLNLQTGG